MTFKERYINARKAYIENRFRDLNPMQREAVMATEGPLLILAGAGSGKTTVLINRIANLLEFGKASDSDELPSFCNEETLEMLERFDTDAGAYAVMDRVMPWQILAITFTNKAADEMKGRLEAKLGSAALDIWACTFHSACVRILRRDGQYIGFGSNFTIYDTADSLSLIKHIIKDNNLDEKYFPLRSVLNDISRAKDSMLLPPEFKRMAELSSDLHKSQIADIYAEYVKRMKASGCMDFDDLILYTVILLQENDEVRNYWKNRFRYVLIDEYQDTNHLQYLLASLLVNSNKNIAVVGDDNQSIYKFRGATIENILNFENEFESCRTIRLEQNYRSTEYILNAANSVIKHNLNRKEKNLWTNNGTGNKIELYVADNEHDEAAYVAGTIMNGFSSGNNWRDFAILYRMNAQSNNMEYALKRNGIPYRIVGGTRFFDRAEVKDILSYMNVIDTPADNLRLERIINNPPRGIGAKSIEAANDLAYRFDKSLFYVISHADMYEELSRPAIRMRQFADMINELRLFAENNSPDAIFDEIIEKTGYIKMLEEKNTVEDTTRAENVRELKTSIIGYMNESGDRTLAGYLANVALYTDLDNYDKDSDAVILMTMHSSKGLEFSNVFIVGMEETIFPSMKAIGESEEMEEERRLCYVAITRAKKSLYLLCARQRMLFGRTNSNRASRFIDEIPDEYINKNIPKGYGFSERIGDRSFRSDSGFGNSYSYYSNSARTADIKLTVNAAPEISLVVGDRIKHKIFGTGTVTGTSAMGGDMLLVIALDSGVTKKLMLKTAAKYLEKL